MRCCGLDFQIIFTDEIGDGDDHRSIFRCCGGSVHIKQATLFVAISALILSAFNGISMGFGIYSINLALDIFLLVVNSICALLVFYALYYDKASILLPFIVTQIAECAGFFILALYTTYYTLTYKKQSFYRKFDEMVMVVSIILGIPTAGWATYVAAKCYNYLKQHSRSDLFVQERSFWR